MLQCSRDGLEVRAPLPPAPQPRLGLRCLRSRPRLPFPPAPPSVAAEMPLGRRRPFPRRRCRAAPRRRAAPPPRGFPLLRLGRLRGLGRGAKAAAGAGLGLAMQPPVVAVADCSLFLCSFQQSRSAVRLKEDMKKLAAAGASSRRRASCGRRLFGVGLAELQQRGLGRDGIPTVVRDVVEYLTRHGKLSGSHAPLRRGFAGGAPLCPACAAPTGGVLSPGERSAPLLPTPEEPGNCSWWWLWRRLSLLQL